MAQLPRPFYFNLRGWGEVRGPNYEKAPGPFPQFLYPFSPNLRFAISAAMTIAALRESGDALPVPARL